VAVNSEPMSGFVRVRLLAISFAKGIAVFALAFLILQTFRWGFPKYLGFPFPVRLYGILYVAAAGGTVGYMMRAYRKSLERFGQRSAPPA
jgi:hypothetical protein